MPDRLLVLTDNEWRNLPSDAIPDGRAMTDFREEIARALYTADPEYGVGGWDRTPERTRQKFLSYADAVLSAIAEAAFR